MQLLIRAEPKCDATIILSIMFTLGVVSCPAYLLPANKHDNGYRILILEIIWLYLVYKLEFAIKNSMIRLCQLSSVCINDEIKLFDLIYLFFLSVHFAMLEVYGTIKQ